MEKRAEAFKFYQLARNRIGFCCCKKWIGYATLPLDLSLLPKKRDKAPLLRVGPSDWSTISFRITMEYITIGFDHILVILHENCSKQLKRLILSLRDMGTQPIVVL